MSSKLLWATIWYDMGKIQQDIKCIPGNSHRGQDVLLPWYHVLVKAQWKYRVPCSRKENFTWNSCREGLWGKERNWREIRIFLACLVLDGILDEKWRREYQKGKKLQISRARLPTKEWELLALSMKGTEMWKGWGNEGNTCTETGGKNCHCWVRDHPEVWGTKQQDEVLCRLHAHPQPSCWSYFMKNFGIGETHLERCLQFLAPQQKRGTEKLKWLVEEEENVWLEVCNIREEDEKTGID